NERSLCARCACDEQNEDEQQKRPRYASSSLIDHAAPNFSLALFHGLPSFVGIRLEAGQGREPIWRGKGLNRFNTRLFALCNGFCQEIYFSLTKASASCFKMDCGRNPGRVENAQLLRFVLRPISG